MPASCPPSRSRSVFHSSPLLLHLLLSPHTKGSWTCCKAGKEEFSPNTGCRPCTRGLSEKYPRIRDIAAVQATQSVEQQCATLERLYRATRKLLPSGKAAAAVDGERSAPAQGEAAADSSDAPSEGSVIDAVRAVERRHELLAAPPARRGSKYLPHVLSRPGSVSKF